MGKKIALIDTENSSASLYSDLVEFDTLDISPPYTVQKYQDAIRLAEREGYDVIVVDSISHAWAAEGGLLSKKDSMDARGGNSFTNFGVISKEHEVFKALLVNCKTHMICTMRSKQDYVIEQNEKGRSAPRKIGLAPIQREGMEYEFTTVLDVAMDHQAQASKDRTGLFGDNTAFKVTKETGEKLMTWLSSAKPLLPLCQCGNNVVLASSGAGYFCPAWNPNDMNHLKFPIAELNAYLGPVAAEVIK
jgi:hypothetical protein